MIDLGPDTRPNGFGRMGAQPIALAVVALVLVLTGTGAVALWRARAGNPPEPDRLAAARQIQARAVQTSEQLVEKTKALDQSQQEAIDQLQALQDEVQTLRHALAAQQDDARRLSDQVAGLTAAVDNLRQSFASARPGETSNTSSRHDRSRPRLRTRIRRPPVRPKS